MIFFLIEKIVPTSIRSNWSGRDSHNLFVTIKIFCQTFALNVRTRSIVSGLAVAFTVASLICFVFEGAILLFRHLRDIKKKHNFFFRCLCCESREKNVYDCLFYSMTFNRVQNVKKFTEHLM